MEEIIEYIENHSRKTESAIKEQVCEGEYCGF